ncbi:MAG: aspartate/glutamate racemase family protein [Gemmatimonadota bacterium]
MDRRVRLGMLTPSSNTTLEPVTARMLAGLPDVTAHFGRFRVTEIGLSARALGQFDLSPMLAAADLLADAKCDTICWNGTSAGWLGFERDRQLCAAVEARTATRASSVVLALDEVFKATGVKRFGLVSPYTDDVQAAIAANFGREGYTCIAERHSSIRVNFDFATISPATTAAMIREVARAAPEAVVVLCTNMDGATIADALERELGIPIYDSIAIALWAALRVAGVAPARVEGFGRLFRELQ